MSEQRPPAVVYSVSQLNTEVRGLLEEAFPSLWVEGEVSNLARPRSGHVYFSLKDDSAQVRCAMFRAQVRRLPSAPENGDKVLARGRVSLYRERGDFQLIVDHLEPAGAGALRQAFERLKAKLHAEGLFHAEHKVPLPDQVRRIGVVTSPSGAALRDVLHVLRRRYPVAEVVIYPASVQGERAVEELRHMLRTADRRAECDVVLLVRGGGSLEDLWAFNDEGLARDIFACATPVVTGIGHEIDFSIADFVADARAPTPSAAAELVSPDRAELAAGLLGLRAQLLLGMRRGLDQRSRHVSLTAKRLRHPRTELAHLAQRTDLLAARLGRAMEAALEARRARVREGARALVAVSPLARNAMRRAELRGLGQRLATSARHRVLAARARLSSTARALHAVSPERTLERGYAVVTGPDGAIVREHGAVGPGDRIEARLARGRIRADVVEE